jgi:MFS family permease
MLMRRLGRKYERFWVAVAASSLGDGLLVTGLPLLARETSKNPIVVASVFAASRVPFIFGLVIGAFVDRRDARKVLIGSDLVRAVVLSLVGAFLLLSSRPLPIWVLLLLSTVLSTGSAIFFSATQRVVPHLVPTEDFDQANSQIQTMIISGEQFIGPPLGAIFLSGGKIPVIGDAISFAASAAILSRLDPIPPAPSTSSLADDIRTGWAWFRNSEIIRTITAITTVMTTLTGAVLATEVVLIQDTLHLSKAWFGAFTAVMAAGSVVGGFVATKLIKAFGNSTYSIGIVLNGLSYLACYGSRSWLVVFTAMFVQQAITMIGLVASLGIRQRVIPSDFRGRVISLTRAIAFTLQLFGALIGGLVAKRFGTDPIFGVCGALLILAGVVTARRLIRLLNIHDPR